ncbi:hypothetical protein F5888DRAFT_1892821 [Russula emetica]|nr:hypothetical protein F5888DRAFT_1892821 [Russula emetica]
MSSRLTALTSSPLLALQLHPDHSDWIIWTGDEGCSNDGGAQCHAQVYFSRDNGLEVVLRGEIRAQLCVGAWPILCESFREKTGSQRIFQMGTNPMQLVSGRDFHKKRIRMFDEIVGFAKFSKYPIVAEARLFSELSGYGGGLTGVVCMQYLPAQRSLDLQVSLDGRIFATGQFPPSMRPEQHAYTILESSTDSVFSNMTTSSPPRPYWDDLLKSNWNGTYFGSSIPNYVDFEDSEMIGLDGIAIINVVSNPEAAAVTGNKELQTRITHNDERFDPRATFSSPSVVGLIMAVGNVGEKLAPYDESDTFLSRDAGFTWEEYKFTNEKIRVRSIVTVPSEMSRRFILLGNYVGSPTSVAVHVDFSALTSLLCLPLGKLDIEDPGHDDFELWSPSEERSERCLFGRQILYHRRRRDRNCVVGQQPEALSRTACARPLTCECGEFNHVRNADDKCVLVEGTKPLPGDDSWRGGAEYWYERTANRRIPHSSCEDGERPDRGRRHYCPGVSSHGFFFFWTFVLIVPFAFTWLVGSWYYKRSGRDGHDSFARR